MKFLDGTVYEGKVIAGRKNGQGKMKYFNGDVYEGNWLNDKYSGNGKLT